MSRKEPKQVSGKLPSKEGLIEEKASKDVDVLIRALDNPKLAKDLARGYFSINQFNWLKGEANRMHGHQGLKSYEESVSEDYDKGRKFRAKKAIIKSVITLVHASRVAPAFSDNDWEEIANPGYLAQIAYVAALMGGYEVAAIIANGLGRGLDEHMQAKTDGMIRGDVLVTMPLSHAEIEKFSDEVTERSTVLMKERLVRRYRLR